MPVTLVFTPPHNGLVAFNQGGLASYGIYLGLSETTLRLFEPRRGVVCRVSIEDTDNYSIELVNFDHQLLVKLGDTWCRGVLVQYQGKQYQVVSIRNRYPPVNNDILVYTTTGREFSLTDPGLKFVGHVNHHA